MRFFIQIVRKYPLSLLCILLIGVLSLAPYFPETPLDDVAFIDKWTHLVMYDGTCATIHHQMCPLVDKGNVVEGCLRKIRSER